MPKRYLLVLLLCCVHPSLSAQDFWEPLPLYGGETYRIIATPDGDAFVGTEAHGLLRSTDQGRSWFPAGLTKHSIHSLYADGKGELYAGTTRSGVGLWRSTDKGQSWVNIYGSGYSRQLAVNSAGTICLGTYGLTPLARSTDKGQSWNELDIDPDDDRHTILQGLVVDSQDRFVAATNLGIYTSEDGAVWTGLENQFDNGNIFAIQVHPDNSIICVADSGVWRKGPEESAFTEVFAVKSGERSVLNRLGTTLYLSLQSARRLYRSTDAGLNWQTMSDDDSEMRDFALLGNGVILSAGGFEGVTRSEDDGSTWQAAGNGILSQSITAVHMDSGGVLYAGNRRGVIFRSVDGGANWTASPFPGLHPVSTIFSAPNGQRLFASVGMKSYWGDGGLYYSDNSGIEWTKVENNEVEWAPIDIAMHPDGSLFLSLSDQSELNSAGLFRKDNLDAKWERLDAVSEGPEKIFVSSMGSIFIPGEDGAFAYRSTDKGESWTAVIIQANELHFEDMTEYKGTLYGIAFRGNLYRSDNDGLAWERIPGGATQVSEFIATDNGTLVAATYQGCLLSSYQGQSWQRLTTGLIISAVRSISASPEGYLYAATAGGVYKSAAITTDVRENGASAAAVDKLKLSLSAPGDEMVEFVYASAGSGNAHIAIFDILGNRVADLHNGRVDAGQRTLRWDSSQHTQGRYFCRAGRGGQIVAVSFSVLR